MQAAECRLEKNLKGGSNFSTCLRMRVIISVGSEPKLGSARLGFGSSFWEKKLGLARHASKKLGSARLALSFKKPSYLEKQKMS